MNEVRNEPTLHATPVLDPELETLERPRGSPPASEPETVPGQRHTYSRGRRRTRHQRRMRRLRWTIALIAVCGIAALLSIVWQPSAVSPPPAVTPSAPPRAANDPSKARYPIESPGASQPALDASDDSIVNVLRGLWSGAGVMPFLEPRNLVRNFVVTVDNLPRRTLPAQHAPLKPTAGSFGTASAGGSLVIGERNALRYAPLVRLLETVDAKQLVDPYVRHYPLFQQAYRELGYPDGHFNDRLVEAIDSLLATPDHKGPLAVVQPKIFYEFADRELEQLPAGQKLLLRMGNDNATQVKAKLREIRRLVANEGVDLVQVLPQPLLR